MHKLTLLAPLAVVSAFAFASLGCGDAGLSPEEVCAHADHFATEEAAQHGASAEQVKKTHEEAHRACVDQESATQKRVDRGKWSAYSHCMVGKKNRAEQAECQTHVR